MRQARRWRGLVGLALGVTLAASGLPASAGSCPGPRCPKYRTFCVVNIPCRYPASADGIVRIPYWVNPTQLWLTEAQAVGAVRAAARAWEMYNPRVRFIYRGTTNEPPIPEDHKLVVAWVPLLLAAGAAYGNAEHGHDVFIGMLGPQTWEPCSTDCRPYRVRYIVNVGLTSVGYGDVQGVITHEFGHVLGLDHPGRGEEAQGLTMDDTLGDYEQPPPGYGSREMSTLGLGDVLGVKKLYPWKCPKPDSKGRYPSAYRYLCPTIKIFVP